MLRNTDFIVCETFLFTLSREICMVRFDIIRQLQPIITYEYVYVWSCFVNMFFHYVRPWPVITIDESPCESSLQILHWNLNEYS